MKFNHYIFKLFKESEKGKNLINLFKGPELNLPQLQELQKNITDEIFSYLFTVDFSKYPIEKGYNDKELEEKFGSTKLSFNIVESVAYYYKNKLKITDIKEIYTVIQNIKEKGISLYHKNAKGETEGVCTYFDEFLLIDYFSTAELSIGLYLAYPEYFFPYLFKRSLYKVEQICEEFNIPFPEIPKKSDIEGRTKYYFDLCTVFYEFRKNHNLTPEEFCAFLYGFTPNFIDSVNDVSNLPSPSKVWIIGSGGEGAKHDFEYLDNIDKNSKDTWNGNVETRKGDIVIMYCLSPRSYIHSIWRAVHDGYIEPYFHWYSMIEIAFPQKVKPITFQELIEDEIFSKKGLVKAHMIGVNGKGLSVEEYHHLLEMLQNKGQDISAFPKIEKIGGFENINLENERDVEIRLIEPFIKQLEYKESDWIRQMPLRMGRGIRYYPDYVFGATQKRGEENAKMIIESKYQVSNEKELFEAYYQAKSYALRLSAQYFVVASKEGIWIFEKDDILSKNNFHKTWNDLLNPDSFHEVLIKIGRNKIL